MAGAKSKDQMQASAPGLSPTLTTPLSIQAEPSALVNECNAPSFEGIAFTTKRNVVVAPVKVGTNHRGLCTKLPPEGGRVDNLGTQ